jgi:hypothetical protein
MGFYGGRFPPITRKNRLRSQNHGNSAPLWPGDRAFKRE